jgi:predicted nucleic acid-binding protein
LYSALRSGGKPAVLLKKLVSHEQGLIGCVSTALLYEYEEILKNKLPSINEARLLRHEQPFTYQHIDDILDTYTACSAQCAIRLSTRPVLNDADDEFIVDLAAMSGAIICTGNTKDFQKAVAPYDLTVLTPSELLEKLQNEAS